MKPRTLEILATLIENFIETASPVASKHLLECKDFNISSATVRNEFALLEEVGFITSPHVSAGKIPTQKGYRYFVDQILKEDNQQDFVHSLFEKHIQEYKFTKSKEVLFDMLRLLSRLSGNVAFSSIENDKTLYIGLSHVLRSPEFIAHPEQVAQIIEILDGRERFRTLLSQLDLPNNEVKIFIGEENMIDEISSCAMIVTRYQKSNIQGYIGILGPMRMKYGFNRSLIKEVLQFL